MVVWRLSATVQGASVAVESESKSGKRILSGVQPSGKLHLGNYFGAIKQHLELQEEGSTFLFIADWHALTTIHDAGELRENIRDVAVAYLALGLDPQKAVFFRHSHVPELQELTWLLATVTGMGLLERAVSYKDKVARGITPSVGLFAYPVLMAADILAYQSDIVPVGQDQVQHIEMTQDMAASFNATYGAEVFRRPEYRLAEASKVPGTDGQKMSKSYGNIIGIFDEGSSLKKRVMGIVTDSTPVEAPKDPAKCNVFALYSLLASRPEQEALASRYRAGGLGYGQVKKELLERIDSHFAPYRKKREELLKNTRYVDSILREGANKARTVAAETLAHARRACGLD
jgi:tryptophanyl-tRNA synthetase